MTIISSIQSTHASTARVRPHSNLSPVARHPSRLFGRFNRGVADARGEAFVVVIAACDVLAKAGEEKNFDGGIDLCGARQPHAFSLTRLLEHESRTGTHGGDEAAADLVAFGKARFEADDLFVFGIDPSDAGQLRDDRLDAVRRLIAGPRTE